MATKAKSTMSDFRFIPIECFYVDAAKSIELDKQGEILYKRVAFPEKDACGAAMYRRSGAVRDRRANI